MNHLLKKFKFNVRMFIGQYPSLFFPIYGLKKTNRDLFITKDTKLVVSAYPRTANTFFIVALEQIQRNKISIAHHMHVPALALEGINRAIPTIVLIRNPEDAIVSFIIRESHISFNQALDAYITFYKPLIAHQDKIIIADFITVTNNFPSIISELNSRFGLNLDNYSEYNKLDKKIVFNEIDEINKRFNKNNLVETMVSRPSDSRKKIKADYQEKLRLKKYQEKLQKCYEVYNVLISKN
jgi:hypothetical protein